MKRRSKAGGKRSKARIRAAVARKGTRRRTAPACKAEKETPLKRELNRAREQQAAMSDVLRIISQSKFELQTVLEHVARAAARLCRSDGAVIFQLENGLYRFAAGFSLVPAYLEIERRTLISPGPGTVVGRAAMTGKVVRIDDAWTDPLYEKKEDAKVEGNRSMIGVPLIRDGHPVAVIGLGRRRLDPFEDHDIKLATTFAAQALIAIENTRLLFELRQRSTDLSEALEQQTATADVLHIISSSPGNLEPVFQAILEKAVSICDAKFGTLFRFDCSAFHLAARVNAPAALAEFQKKRGPFLPPSGSNLDRMMKTKQVQHSADDAAESIPAQGLRLGGARSIVHVPMLQDEQLVGALVIYRQEVRPFIDKQIELLKNFAAQAVIAIENARLLNELRESLQQQTATADVLKIISRSTFDLTSVLQTLVESAARLCDADCATVTRQRDGRLVRAEAYGYSPEFLERLRSLPVEPGRGSAMGRALLEGKVIQIADALADPEYTLTEVRNLGGYRTMLGVPMLREGVPIGVLTLTRLQVCPFTDKQIELVATFAAQAVIAIENARLLNELRERTDQIEAQSKQLANLNRQLEQRVADQVGEIERMSRLRRFLPPQVADLIVASGSEKQLESHRREITALFCDLRGFTGFSESADPEDVIALLRDYHAAIGKIIVKYSGTLERYAGDGVMVVFNDPVPVENPALQAVLMALDLRQAIGALTENWRRWGHDIGFGIGIAHGYATLGTIGFEGRFDYAAIGTVSNVASRLCDEAKSGQILITPRVLTTIGDAVTVEPIGEFELKGIRRPLAAHNVLALKSAS